MIYKNVSKNINEFRRIFFCGMKKIHHLLQNMISCRTQIMFIHNIIWQKFHMSPRIPLLSRLYSKMFDLPLIFSFSTSCQAE